MKQCFFLLLGTVGLSSLVWAQAMPDSRLMQEINRTAAIDNHTHVPKVVKAGEKDDDYDALPCAPLQPTADPTMVRPDNPLFLQAWQTLYGYPYNDRKPDHVQQLLATRERIKAEQGENFPGWVLGKLNIAHMLANRIAMGPGLTSPRFLWVPYDDALLLPLNNKLLASRSPDREFFYGREEMLLKRYLEAIGVKVVPPIASICSQFSADAARFASLRNTVPFSPAARLTAPRLHAARGRRKSL